MNGWLTRRSLKQLRNTGEHTKIFCKRDFPHHESLSRRRSVREKFLFEYAVIRIVPRVEREEFINVGVIVYCPAQSFLAVEFEISEQKLRAFAPDLEIAEIEKHLRAFEQISRGGDD